MSQNDCKDGSPNRKKIQDTESLESLDFFQYMGFCSLKVAFSSIIQIDYDIVFSFIRHCVKLGCQSLDPLL